MIVMTRNSVQTVLCSHSEMQILLLGGDSTIYLVTFSTTVFSLSVVGFGYFSRLFSMRLLHTFPIYKLMV